MKVKTMIEKIIEDGDSEKMYKLNDMLNDLIYDLKDSNPKMYNEYKMELYEIAYDKKINEEMAKDWVKSMKPKGEYWTLEQTTEAMKNMDYNCDKVEFYIASNMMVNDYYDLVKDNEELALKMAYDFLNDEDAIKSKLYEYWKYIVKRD